MDTSSDSDGAHSPVGVYGQMTYTAAPITDYDDPMIIKSPSRHSESSTGSGGSVDEPCTKAHHKFSIDRILGRFNGGNATATTIDSCPETSDPAGKLHHRSELVAHGAAAGECLRQLLQWSVRFIIRPHNCVCLKL